MKLNKPTVSVFIVLCVLLLGLFFFKKNIKKTNTDKSEEIKAQLVSVQEFDQMAKREETFVLDVHTPEQVHIPATDAFIPFDQIKQNMDKLPKDKTTTILVYCRSGSMSQQASQELISLGYEKVYNLTGGINEYKKNHQEVVIRPSIKNLAEVVYGEKPETSFILTNFSPFSLGITRLSTSCGCTKAKIEKDRLDPYEEVEIKVTFDPAVHQDATDLGHVTRTIYIETDHPDFSRLTADITANVVTK